MDASLLTLASTRQSRPIRTELALLSCRIGVQTTSGHEQIIGAFPLLVGLAKLETLRDSRAARRVPERRRSRRRARSLLCCSGRCGFLGGR
jgi:hypothetical protein